MRTLQLILATLVFTGAVHADDWRQLNNDEIKKALIDRQIVYKNQRNASQTFYANGDTGYVDGRPSRGNWRVDNNQYCSQWPPSTSWECYDVYLRTDKTIVRFRGTDKVNWDGTYQ